jgi:hypothetical protein
VAKRARLKEEDATAYIQAGTLPDGATAAPVAPEAISKDTKVWLVWVVCTVTGSAVLQTLHMSV